jgi:ADP-ribose pyrophosphatase YjhB (NUDIX family)
VRLIVDGQQRVLLFRGEVPGREPWWFAPGAAFELDETYESALVREVMEETGLVVDIATLLPPVWTREFLFPWQGRRERHLERFFLIRIDTHEVDTSRFEDGESGVIRTYRWWGLDDITRSSERFSPVRLGEHLAPLLQGTLPDHPVVVGRSPQLLAEPAVCSRAASTG